MLCDACHILSNRKLIARAMKVGSLYHLDCETSTEQANVERKVANEKIWHRRFGHLGNQYLRKFAKDKLVNGCDCDMTKENKFCEVCERKTSQKKVFS